MPGAAGAAGRQVVVASKFDLEFTVAEAGGEPGLPGGLAGVVTAAADLFDHATAKMLAARFSRVLAAVAAAPQARLHEIGVLSQAERDQVVSGWNDTAAPVPAAGEGVAGLLGRQAARTPDAVAVVCGAGWVSYAELEARAWRLAGVLAACGAGPEVVVALALERGPELITAIWAVWLTGAAYLPLDPGHPAERIAFMLADSRASVVAGTSALLDELPAGRIVTVAVDDPPAAAARRRSRRERHRGRARRGWRM